MLGRYLFGIVGSLPLIFVFYLWATVGGKILALIATLESLPH